MMKLYPDLRAQLARNLEIHTFDNGMVSITAESDDRSLWAGPIVLKADDFNHIGVDGVLDAMMRAVEDDDEAAT